MRLRLKLMLAALLFGVTLSGTAGAETPPPLPQLFGGPFHLVDHDGMPRSDKDYRGRYLLIYFGYTYCPTICPTNLQHMADAMDLLGTNAGKVQPLFITIDPARDTPDLLKDYVANFGPRFVGLTGTEAEIRKVAKAYRIHRRKVPQDDDDDTYLVDHSSITYLMGPDGKFATLFPHDTSGEEIARRIRTYFAAPGS